MESFSDDASRLVSLEQFQNLNPMDMIYYINPFGYGSKKQCMVDIQHICVSRVVDDRVVSLTSRDHFVQTLSSHFTYSCKIRAEAQLKKVRSGFYSDVVKEHHDSCRQEEVAMGWNR